MWTVCGTCKEGHVRLSSGFNGLDYQRISVQTPSLKYLDYTDFVHDVYPKVNVESLEETNFYLEVVEYREWFGEAIENPDCLSSNPTNIIEGIKNVKSLTLSSSLILGIFLIIELHLKIHSMLYIYMMDNVWWTYLRWLVDFHWLQTLYFFRESIHLFENLHHLTMRHSDMRVWWQFLPFFLSKTPNLKTLHIIFTPLIMVSNKLYLLLI